MNTFESDDDNKNNENDVTLLTMVTMDGEPNLQIVTMSCWRNDIIYCSTVLFSA